jgi:hypothetical protein
MTTPHTAVAHKFRKEAPYPILWECTLFNLLYMAMCHYSDKRIARLMEMLNDEKYLSPKHHRTVNNLYEEIFTAENKRIKQDYYRQTRVHDDDWFFAKNVLFR